MISAHKSVAELGVIGRAEDMHRIMDAERDATLAYLDRVTRQMGGRRGEAAVATATGGLIYAHTRHATSRAGDPCPHDHVLVANLVEMADAAGRLEGGRHRVVARAPARRHHGRPGGRRPGGGRAGLWDRGRPGAVREARTLAYRRRARRGDRGALQAGGGDRRGVRPPGRDLLSGPGGGGPHHPPGQGRRRRGRSGGPVAGRAGRHRLAGRAPGRVGGRRRPAQQAGPAV